MRGIPPESYGSVLRSSTVNLIVQGAADIVAPVFGQSTDIAINGFGRREYVLQGSAGAALTLDGTPATTSNTIPLADNQSARVTIEIHGGAGANAGAWDASGVLARGVGASSASWAGDVAPPMVDDVGTVPALTMAISADTNNGTLSIVPSGAWGTFVAHVRLVYRAPGT